jgi:hypothetical protein
MKKSICIATSYDTPFRQIGDYAAMTLRCYARRHGYAALIEDNIAIDRPPSWHCVRLIPQLFDRGFDFVMWIDADAIFSRFDVDVADLITESHDLYMVSHEHPVHSPPLVPNMGVILARNCLFCRDLFARLWAMEQYRDHPWWENAAMIKLLGLNSLLREGEDMPADDIIARIKFLSTAWNCIPSICADVDPVIRHFAGYTFDDRQREIPKCALAACFQALGEVYHKPAISLRRRLMASWPSLVDGLPARFAKLLGPRQIS